MEEMLVRLREILQPLEQTYSIVWDKKGFHIEQPQYVWVPFSVIESIEDKPATVDIWLRTGWVKLWKNQQRIHCGFKAV